MLKRRLGTVFMLMAFSALIVTGCYRTPEQRAEHFVKHMAAELKLDAAQTAKLEAIKDEFLAKRPELIKSHEEAVKEANELMRSAVIDQARLNALLEKQKGMASDVVTFISAKFVEIHDMLTPEQREKLVSMIEKHMMHGHGRPANETQKGVN